MLVHAGLIEEAGWVRHHHERVDGAGYPDHLAGDEIPLEARIIFVADSFEAMTSDRPYRAGMEVEDAVAELRRCSGTQFEPEIVEALAHLVEEGEAHRAGHARPRSLSGTQGNARSAVHSSGPLRPTL